MTTPEIKTATIELDRPRTLRMDFNALVRAEETTGKNFVDARNWIDLDVREDEQTLTAFVARISTSGLKLTAADTRALLHACLLHEDASLTLEQVGAWLHPGNQAAVRDALLGLWAAFMPEPKQSETADADGKVVPLAVAAPAA